MTYAAVVHLRNLLEEEIICFLRRVQEAEKPKALEFQAKANEGSNKLVGFKNSKDSPNSHQTGLGKRQRVEADEELITCCKQTSEAAISLRHRVDALMRQIKGSNNDDEVNRIKLGAEKAAECIEDVLTGFEFLDGFVKVKNLYDLLKRVAQLLSDSLQTPDEPSCGQKMFDIIRRSPRRTISPEQYPHLELRARKRQQAICRKHLGKDAQNNISSLIDELIGPALELKIVSIWKAADSRETSLATRIFGHPIVIHHFDCRSTVNIGTSTIDDVLSRTLFSIYPPCNYKTHGLEDNGELLYKSLKGQKYLVVLDGLRDSQVWDAIQKYFPDDKVGSRVLLSSVLNPTSCRKLYPEHEVTVVGLDEETGKIIDELTRPPLKLLAVTIAGMGGVGKTTLARKVFHHPFIVNHFHCHAWISTISSSSTDQVLSQLLLQIAPMEEIRGKSLEDKGELLYRSLKGRKYLIAVDDLWKFEVWEAVLRYFPDDNVGSRILVTSRMIECPGIHIPKNPPHCLKPLDKGQSWELLEKLVFHENDCPVMLVNHGKRIAEGCGGLPLAIHVIAGILRSIPKLLVCWWSIECEVISIISSNAEVCLDILDLSYKRLPHHLKACFLFMGAFPANSEIGVEYLLNLWIASGLLETSSLSWSETEASNHLEDLIGRNLVSVGKRGLDGSIKTCRIHALVRELCLGEARKQNFMDVLEAGANAQVQEKQRHLIFNLDHLDDYQLLPPLPHLCSFIWLNHGSGFTPDMVLLQLSIFKWLRVLDIYFLPMDAFPLQLLNLVNLRYLALNVSYVLDARISQLSKLQTIVIFGPWVTGESDGNPGLFLEFWKMPCLRNVYVKVPSCLRYPPLDVSLQTPSNLQSLSIITISSCTKEVLFLMPNLKRLEVFKSKADYENGDFTKCFPNVSFLAELQTLKCSFYKGNGEARSLDLDGLPANLKKLTLDGGGFTWNKMKVLALLPKLETLKLKACAFQGAEWSLTEEVFGSLKHLLIDNADIVSWEVESTDHFPCLQHLVLRSCNFLKKIPEGVGELSILRVLELCHCSESANTSAKEFEEQYGNTKVIIKS